MNIGLLIYDLRSGGAERVLCKWSDLLNEEHNIFLYTYDGSSEPEYDYSGTLRMLNVPSKGKNKFNQIVTLYIRYYKLKKQLKKDKIDLLISFCSTANFPAMFQKISRIASIRLYSEYFSYRKIYRFLIKKTETQLVVQTYRLKNDILNDIGEKYSSKIKVIGNPLDLSSIRKKIVEDPEKSFMNAIAGKKVICFTASFKSSKNHCNLLKSFKLLCQELENVVLVLIGADGELENHIYDMVKKSSIADSVIFLGKQSNPFKYEKMADLFVLPSLYEGIPNALIEAMAVGLPVVATDCPSGPKEILCNTPELNQVVSNIEKADYGILIQPFENTIDFNMDNISEQNIVLANAMKILLIDSELNNYYRKQSLIRVEKYDMDGYKKILNDVIVECIK